MLKRTLFFPITSQSGVKQENMGFKIALLAFNIGLFAILAILPTERNMKWKIYPSI